MEPLTSKELDALAKELPVIKAWVAAVEAELLRRLEAEEQFDYVAYVPKRPSRLWNPEIDPVTILRKFANLSVVAPRTPLSPSQAEKTLGKLVYKDALAKHVVKVSSGMTLDFITPKTENLKAPLCKS